MANKINFAAFALTKLGMPLRDVSSIFSNKIRMSKDTVSKKAEKGALLIDHFVHNQTTQLRHQRRVYLDNIENISEEQDIFCS